MRGRDPVGSDVAANVLICVLGAGIALSVSSWLAAAGGGFSPRRNPSAEN